MVIRNVAGKKRKTKTLTPTAIEARDTDGVGVPRVELGGEASHRRVLAVGAGNERGPLANAVDFYPCELLRHIAVGVAHPDRRARRDAVPGHPAITHAPGRELGQRTFSTGSSKDGPHGHGNAVGNEEDERGLGGVRQGA